MEFAYRKKAFSNCNFKKAFHKNNVDYLDGQNFTLAV